VTGLIASYAAFLAVGFLVGTIVEYRSFTMTWIRLSKRNAAGWAEQTENVRRLLVYWERSVQMNDQMYGLLTEVQKIRLNAIWKMKEN
jgi:hypothetical protein